MVFLHERAGQAWHRKAEALTRLNEWDEAIKAAEEGQKVDPSNVSFGKLIEKATADKAKDAEDKARLGFPKIGAGSVSKVCSL